ncbi:MAG: hypothetical protein GF355_11440 [Candidatus Eisenbacteria bacterium]|nr:hypothetical protein [Candidatus Eisenbacteria bacterium]
MKRIAIVMITSLLLQAPPAIGAGIEAPVGIVAAGDSLWFLNAEQAAEPHARRALPVRGEVHNLAVQSLVRPPEYLRDVRVCVATDHGLHMWTPRSDTLALRRVGNVLDVEASTNSWIALVHEGAGSDKPALSLLVEDTNETAMLFRPNSWGMAYPLPAGVRTATLAGLRIEWLSEQVEGVSDWSATSRGSGSTVALLSGPQEPVIQVRAVPNVEDAGEIALPPLDEDPQQARIDSRFFLPLGRYLAVLESGTAVKPRVRLIGGDFQGEAVWTSDEDFAVVDAVPVRPQGPYHYWIVAAGTELRMLQVSSQRFWNTGRGEVQEAGRRGLSGDFTAMAAGGGSWAVVAYEPGSGATVIDVFDPTDPEMPPLTSMQVRGRVDAVGIAASDALWSQAEYERRFAD